MTSIEARLFESPNQNNVGQDRAVLFPEEPTGIQTKIEPFRFISVTHLEGPEDIVRIQEHDDQFNASQTYQPVDLKPGQTIRVYAPHTRHAFIRFYHPLASERVGEL